MYVFNEVNFPTESLKRPAKWKLANSETVSNGVAGARSGKPGEAPGLNWAKDDTPDQHMNRAYRKEQHHVVD